MLATVGYLANTQLMDKQNGPRFTQDISSLAASVLPILQLFFAQLPEAVRNTFQAQSHFTGISLVTLLLSYILIIAFQSKPWFEIVLPWQRKARKEYLEYQDRLYKGSTALDKLGEEHGKEVSEYVEMLKEKPVSAPSTLKRDNLVSFATSVVIVSAVAFLILALLPHDTWVAIVQSISYVLLITFSVLILSVYRSTIQNNTRYEEERATKVIRAIDLAIEHNVFTHQPSVRVVESFDAAGYPDNLNIVAEYEGQYYHVITDSTARRLIRGRKLDSYKEDS